MLARKYEMRVRESRVPYLVTVGRTKISDSECYNQPEKVAEILRTVYHVERLPEEHIFMLAFDNRMHLMGVFDLSHGTVDASLMSPAAVIQRAMLIGAKCICIAHNHPSGDVSPSADDRKATKRLKAAADICDITLCDHLIIGGANKRSLYSFKKDTSELE